MNLSKIDLRSGKIQFIIFAVLLGIGSGSLWYLHLFKDYRTEVQALRIKKERKERELATIRALKPQLENLRREAAADSMKLVKLRSRFPDEKEIPKLIREITKVARASHIHTKKFNPLPDVEREHYVENKYNLMVEGGYHELANFFAFLANMPLIVNLGRVKIVVNPTIENALDQYEEYGGLVRSTLASFQMTTFSSRN